MWCCWKKQFNHSLHFGLQLWAHVFKISQSTPALTLAGTATKELEILNMAELNLWDQNIISEILSYKKFPVTLVKDFEIFLLLSFNRHTYSAIVNLIKESDWESLKSNKDENETSFIEDLALVKFTNQNNQNCLATIYDSDELWQDPQIIDVFILT